MSAGLSLRKPTTSCAASTRSSADMERAGADGPPAVRRRGLRQDRGGAARRLQMRHARRSSAPFWCPPPSWPGSIIKRSCGAWRASRSRWSCSPASATPKQQEEIIRQLRSGRGGHRRRHPPAAVQGRAASTIWGLFIIDEEQRFGVAQKEKLKELLQERRRAHPVGHPHPPHAATWPCRGIRDMSVIEEAPQDRHPVQTYVLEYDDGVIIGRHPPGAAPGRAGVLSAQPGGDPSNALRARHPGRDPRGARSASPTAR